MIIAGIDFSKNSPGIVKFELDENLDIKKIDYLGFTTVKKNETLGNLIYYKKEQFDNDIAQAIFLRDNIKNFLKDDWPEYVAIENYAFAAQGKIFDIAESTMCSKLMLYESGSKIRLYDPCSIKKISTMVGNADKVRMEEEYNKLTCEKPDLSKLPNFKTPKEDIIDAYFVAKLLQLELKLRKGIVLLRNLEEYQIEVFNRTTKAYPENILCQNFIYKK